SFFFQAEDGIRDFHVTGVQTCALPILSYDNTLRLDGIHWRHVKFIEQFDGPYNGRWLLMSDVCKHCVQAGCLEVCPTGAIIRTRSEERRVGKEGRSRGRRGR